MSIQSGFSYAEPDLNEHKFIDYLSAEKMHLVADIQSLSKLAKPQDEPQYFMLLQRNKTAQRLIGAKIENLNNFLINQNEIRFNFNQKLKQLLEKQKSQTDTFYSRIVIDNMNTHNELNKKIIKLLQQTLNLAQQYQRDLLSQEEQLNLWQAHFKMKQNMAAWRIKEYALETELGKLLEHGLQLQNIISASIPQKNHIAEIELLINNQKISLTQYQLAELSMLKRLAKADYLLLKSPDIRTLQTVTEIYQSAIGQLNEISQALKKMSSLLTKATAYVTDQNSKNALTVLLKTIRDKITALDIQQQVLEEDLENQQAALKKQLASRHSLFENSTDSWSHLMSLLGKTPLQFYQYLKNLTFKLYDNYQWLDSWPMVLMWAGIAFLTVLYLLLFRFLKKLAYDKERQRLSGHLYDGFIYLIYKNSAHLVFLVGFLYVMYMNHIAYPNYQLLFNLVIVWLVFRSLILVAKRSLLERLSDVSGQDVRLYHRLKWLLLAGGWTTVLMIFSHLLPLSLSLQDLFSRLFMLFLLLLSLVALRSREAIFHVLDPLLENRKRYLKNTVSILVILIPLTLLTTAILGLIGYINLAWTMSAYQIQLLALIVSFVIARGLLFDLFEFVSEWVIHQSTHGWLWTEVFLKPGYKVCRALLTLGSIYLLFCLFDWQNDPKVLAILSRTMQYPLVNSSGIHITLQSLTAFFVLLMFFLWISKWTREFCYRWVYKNTQDSGVRNSLSVFTQYAVILLGSLITLRVLGLDFTGMTMILGGLAVGMGFGLRDFASNIVGGLMLLIERPVREGDLITIGEYEGKVAHIGIRSMRVSSWDNMEVLIPNAETFNKPFTNWTHQDSIVRTVVPIKIARSDDPILVQQLIDEVLKQIPEVLPHPAPQVFLKQIDEALIVFEVRYFINVALHTRFEIRSKVLFAITAKFKEAGITEPVPPLSIEIKENDVTSLSSSERVGAHKISSTN